MVNSVHSFIVSFHFPNWEIASRPKVSFPPFQNLGREIMQQGNEKLGYFAETFEILVKMFHFKVIIGHANVAQNILLDSCPINEQVQGALSIEKGSRNVSPVALLFSHFLRKLFKTMVSPIFSPSSFLHR